MDVHLEQVGKRFGRNWVIRSMDYSFQSGHIYGVRGPNGSGKSTLIRMLCGFLTPSSGRIHYRESERDISRDEVFKYVNIAAPYIELIEEFTFRELLEFHHTFKPFEEDRSISEIIELLALESFEEKRIADFSSGMKQRLRLVLALSSKARLVLLDEPTTNLDVPGTQWFSDLLKDFAGNKTIIIASNEPDDFNRCKTLIDVMDYK